MFRRLVLVSVLAVATMASASATRRPPITPRPRPWPILIAPVHGVTCGYYGGTYCSTSGACPKGYHTLPSTWDCPVCCRW